MKLAAHALVAALAAVLITTTSALAGSGVGGVFNLGQVNTVDAQTVLNGNPGANPELKVVNNGSGAAVRGETNSGDPTSAGVLGKNNGGGPGLKATVSPGVPPLAVNSSAKVLNLNADLLDGLDSGGLWKLGGNAGTTPGTDFLGTTDNQALELKVNGQRALRIEPDPTSPNLIGGFSGNAVTNGAVGATIAGGGLSGFHNLVSDNEGTVGGGIHNIAGDQDAGGDPLSAERATVSGGYFNMASGPNSTVGGGGPNTASGDASTVGGGVVNTAGGLSSTVAGGNQNVASGDASTVGGGESNTAGGGGSTVAGGLFNTVGDNQNATVGGGWLNTASGLSSTVAGGDHNTASGRSSAVAGGFSNTASGRGSFAAGTQAKATQDGAFVWGDNTFADLTSPAANTFTVRASGGIWLGTTSSPSITSGHLIDTSTGAYLSSAGAWTNASDRALKHDLRALKTKDVLDRVVRMPISSWSYKAEQPGVRHIGPMAQDFYTAFGLGLDNKHITTIDEGGVALAAIQGLVAQKKALVHKVDSLERENHSLNARLSAQNARLTKLERAVSGLSR